MASEAPAANWMGQPVPIESVERELARLRREGTRRGAGGEPVLATRTNVLNLIVHASTRQEVEHVAGLIERLGMHHPSRALILLVEPDAEGASAEAWIRTHVLDLPGTGRRLAFEQVTIAARGRAARSLPAVIDPLLISELPNFLWWLRELPFHSPLFAQEIDLADRLIVDSSTFGDLPRSLHELAELAVIPTGLAVSDFAWGRLRPWRELVAQFFDPPALLPSLGAIEYVDLYYEPRGPGGHSGLSQGILALGWLCSRLGWQVWYPPRAEGDGAWSWTLEAGGREVDVALRPQHEGDGVSGMRSLTLGAGGGHPGSFLVYREGTTSLATNVNVPGIPQPNRSTRAAIRDEAELLLQDLGQFGRDPIYNGALVFAAQLARGLDEAAR